VMMTLNLCLMGSNQWDGPMKHYLQSLFECLKYETRNDFPVTSCKRLLEDAFLSENNWQILAIKAHSLCHNLGIGFMSHPTIGILLYGFQICSFKWIHHAQIVGKGAISRVGRPITLDSHLPLGSLFCNFPWLFVYTLQRNIQTNEGVCNLCRQAGSVHSWSHSGWRPLWTGLKMSQPM
jgi:hypothetical protein